MSTWFRNRTIWLGTLIACFVSLAFIFCAIPAFSNLPNGAKDLPVIIVNQDDTQIANKVSAGLKQNLPFKHVYTTNTLADAKQQVKTRDASLVIALPQGFSERIQNHQNPELKFVTNDANGMVQTNVNQGLINTVTSQVNLQLKQQTMVGMIAQQMVPKMMKSAMQTAMPAAIKAAMAKSHGQTNPQAVQKRVQAQVETKVKAQVLKTATAQATKTNLQADVSINRLGTKQVNYQHQMAPMMMEMGQYLGIMLGSIVLVLTFMSARFSISKMQAFVGLQLTGIITAVVVALVTVGCLRILVSFDARIFNSLLWHNLLFDLTVFEFTSGLALLLGGLPSMIIQLPLFILQVMAGGGIIPRAAMPSFYHFISESTPLYQGIYGDFNLLAGLGNTGAFAASLWWILVTGLIVAALSIWIGYRGQTKRGLSAIMPFKA